MTRTARRVATHTWHLAAALSLALLVATALQPTGARAMDDHYETVMGGCAWGGPVFYTVAIYDGVGAYTGSNNFYGCFSFDQHSVYICDGNFADYLGNEGANPDVACDWYDADGEWPGGVNPREEEPTGPVVRETTRNVADPDTAAVEADAPPAGPRIPRGTINTVGADGTDHAADIPAAEDENRGA